MKLVLISLLFMFSPMGLTHEFLSEAEVRGEARLTWFGLTVYRAKLWETKPGEQLYEAPLALEIEYRMSLKGDAIAKESEKQLRHLGESEELISKWSDQLKETFPDVSRGDRILALFKPDSGVSFYLNNKDKLGEFNDPDFSRRFLNIWLGEKTSEPELRKNLLGLN